MLKTKCKECIFNIIDNPCALDKPIVQKSDGQYTIGYCRHKRVAKWREIVDPREFEDNDFILQKVNEEETRLAVVVVCLDNNIEKLKDTLSSLSLHKDFIKQLIVTVHKAHGQNFLDILETISSFGIPWNLENLKGDDEYVFYDVYDYVSSISKQHWIVAVEAGYLFKDSDLGSVQSILSYDMNNYVAFYNKDYFIANIFAFHELGGNYGGSWLDKIKAFSNWEQVCHKLD